MKMQKNIKSEDTRKRPQEVSTPDKKPRKKQKKKKIVMKQKSAEISNLKLIAQN